MYLLAPQQLHAPHPLPPLLKGEGVAHERIEAGAEEGFYLGGHVRHLCGDRRGCKLMLRTSRRLLQDLPQRRDAERQTGLNVSGRNFAALYARMKCSSQNT